MCVWCVCGGGVCGWCVCVGGVGVETKEYICVCRWCVGVVCGGGV